MVNADNRQPIEDTLNMVDIESTCRACMKKCDYLVNLFYPVEEGLLFEILSQCTNLQVDKDDGLPQNVCIECADFLQKAASFRIQACKSDTEFRKIIKVETPLEINVKIKNEDDDWIIDDRDNSYNNEAIDFNSLNFEFKVKTENKLYKCDICDKEFTNEKKITKHLKYHTKNLFSCIYCKRCFKTQTLLDNHIIKRHNVDSSIEIKNEVAAYQCMECNKTFDTEKSFAAHLKTHNTRCETCGAEFSNYKQYKSHLKLHNDKIYKCEHCAKSYSKQDHLKYHIRTKHEGLKPYICLHCSKGFYQKCNLKDHLLIHTGETPFLCSECGKSFNSRSNLRQHVMRHSGVRPFPCKLCPKSFTTKGQLTVHTRTHTGEHPFKCEECGACFTTGHSLRKHQNIHLGVRPYPCDVCDKRFTNPDHLKRHRLIHTGDKPYACPLCAHAFRQSNDLNKHLRVHIGPNIYQCTLCDMKFRTQTELKKHYPQEHFNHSQTTANFTLPSDTKYTQNIMSEEPNIDSTKERITITFHEHDIKNGLAGNITIS